LTFSRDLEKMKQCFHHKKSVEEIFTSLEKLNNVWSMNTLNALKQASPLSLKVTLKAIEELENASLHTAYKLDYRISLRMIYTEDFKIGIESLLNEESPKWKSTLQSVSDSVVDQFFKPLVWIFF
jgi:3-hydroxyisobutyryl-CoA hydrolase